MQKSVILLAWWFLAWGLHDNHYGLINRVGPFDSQEDCEFYRNRVKHPHPQFPMEQRNFTSPSCWFTREQVIEAPKEAPRAR